MERFVDWLLTWSYNIPMSALCGFGVATIVWRAVD